MSSVPGNHVLGTVAGMDVGYLEAGWREMVIATVPFHGGEFRQGRRRTVNRVVGQLWIGDMPLLAMYAQFAVE